MFCPQCGQPVPDGAAFCPACGSQLPVPVASSAGQDHDPETAAAIAAPSHPPLGAAGYAGFWRRAVAFLIDTVVLGIVTFPLAILAPFTILTESDFPSMIGKALAFAATRGVITWLYFALLESSPWQATLGKRAIGIRVTDTSGARIPFGRATGRFFGKLLSGLIFCLGFLMAAFTARKQALHDLLAGTLVVR